MTHLVGALFLVHRSLLLPGYEMKSNRGGILLIFMILRQCQQKDDIMKLVNIDSTFRTRLE